jgi:hypothetical protein
MKNQFNWYTSLSKNKTLEIEGYQSKNFGILLNTRFGSDHSGFSIEISFWYTISIQFYDNRHADQR